MVKGKGISQGINERKLVEDMDAPQYQSERVVGEESVEYGPTTANVPDMYSGAKTPVGRFWKGVKHSVETGYSKTQAKASPVVGEAVKEALSITPTKAGLEIKEAKIERIREEQAAKEKAKLDAEKQSREEYLKSVSKLAKTSRLAQLRKQAGKKLQQEAYNLEKGMAARQAPTTFGTTPGMARAASALSAGDYGQGVMKMSSGVGMAGISGGDGSSYERLAIMSGAKPKMQQSTPYDRIAVMSGAGSAHQSIDAAERIATFSGARSQGLTDPRLKAQMLMPTGNVMPGLSPREHILDMIGMRRREPQVVIPQQAPRVLVTRAPEVPVPAARVPKMNLGVTTPPNRPVGYRRGPYKHHKMPPMQMQQKVSPKVLENLKRGRLMRQAQIAARQQAQQQRMTQMMRLR